MNTGILLINLGSPQSTNPSDVKIYLDEFLMDKYVIDLPFILRYLLVKGIILNVRPKKSAEAYASIWSDSGSPLISISQTFQKKFQALSQYPVGLAMRYSEPSIQSGIQSLLDENPTITRIISVPLYPHYAMATTQTVIEKVDQVISASFAHLHVEHLPPFYNHPAYINALSDVIGENLDDSIDYVLFSYHGIPVRHVKKTDPTSRHCYKYKDCCFIPNIQAQSVCYPHQVKQTTLLVANALSLPESQWSWSFQSRLGIDEWLSPATDSEIKRLAMCGVRRLAVCCPAFVSDCLETLEEIGEEAKELFLENGGESFRLIPCLNDDDRWVSSLHSMIRDWMDTNPFGTN